MIPSAGGVDFWGATELAEAGDEGGVEEAALMEVFNKGRVGLIVHGADDVFHTIDGGERL